MCKKCNILFPHDIFDVVDTSGCLKKEGHYDHHVCKTKDGILIAWYFDYSCTCGCCDDIENNSSDLCITYWEVNSISS